MRQTMYEFGTEFITFVTNKKLHNVHFKLWANGTDGF